MGWNTLLARFKQGIAMANYGRLGFLLSVLAIATSARADESSGTSTDPNPAAASADLLPDPARRAAVRGLLPQGVLLVPESTNRRVIALDPTTGDVLDLNFIPADAVNLQTPIQAKLSEDGTRVLVSDQIRDVIQAFSVDTGLFIETFAPAGGANTAIADNVRGWEYAPNGNALLTVGSSANANAIAQFSPTGAPLANFIAPGVGGIASPFDVYRLPRSSGALAEGQYLVSNSSNGQVNRFAADGSPIGLFATAGTFAQQIYMAANGNILVAAFSPPAGEGVYEFTPSGTQVARLDNATLSGYRGAYELANGNILTTTGSGIHEIDRTTGDLVRTIVPSISARYIQFVRSVADADLVLTGSIGAIAVNMPFTLSLTLRNDGPGLATAAEVEVSLPPGVVHDADDCSTTAIPGGRRWAAGDLAAASQTLCSLTLRSTVPGSFSIGAVATSAVNDPNPANNVLSLRGTVPALPVPVMTLPWSVILLLGVFAIGIWLTMRRSAL